ncbi:probable elastin-binding protein EbpS [Nasonia vitripennis]|uniref:Uncharacterized protein n=1 Tax=Nasonia vitripennis TaxID=7425 RepID=A0A7M7QFC0_NASVI|nr:probable elastin-binding protein EbpS [Nasonia vitripennis]
MDEYVPRSTAFYRRSMYAINNDSSEDENFRNPLDTSLLSTSNSDVISDNTNSILSLNARSSEFDNSQDVLNSPEQHNDSEESQIANQSPVNQRFFIGLLNEADDNESEDNPISNDSTESGEDTDEDRDSENESILSFNENRLDYDPYHELRDLLNKHEMNIPVDIPVSAN